MQKENAHTARQADAISELVELLRHNVVRWKDSREQASEFAERVVPLILAHAKIKDAIGH